MTDAVRQADYSYQIDIPFNCFSNDVMGSAVVLLCLKPAGINIKNRPEVTLQNYWLNLLSQAGALHLPALYFFPALLYAN